MTGVGCCRIRFRPMLPDMDAHSLATARIGRFLEREPVVWLSTVRADGRPHLVPTWFVWDGQTVVIVSKPGAVKVANLRADPRAMLALGDADDDFDVGLLEATAEIATEPTPLVLPPGFAAKYGSRIEAMGLTVAQFARTYAQVIRLTPVRALGWHGRSSPSSVTDAARRVAAVGVASLHEPRRGLRQWLGEPLAQGFGRVGSSLAQTVTS
jgi:PPOX class probable F420-dependent enzyme